MAAKTFAEIAKFNPYHDNQGRFASANGAASFTYAPGKSTAHDKAIQRGKEAAQAEKGFKGTLYHGSPATDIEEFDMSRAGTNTSSGEKLLFFTDSKQMAEDFSYERLEGSSKFFQRRGKKGRVYEVDVEMKNPLDFRNLSDKDIDNLIKLDPDGLLTKEVVQRLSGNHQLLKASLDLSAESLKKLGYDGLIANTGKAGHNSLEYAVVDSSQAKILKAAPSAMTFDEILKFNPYHDNRGRFASANSATSFTHRTRDPAKQGLADAAIAREKERQAEETPRMKAIHSIEDKIRNQNYETAAIIDKDGNVLLNKDGGQRQVGFTPLEGKLMKDNTLTHNHPSSSMFSEEDISCFVANEMQEIRATTREGVTFSVKRGEGYSRADGTVFLLEYQINAGLARNTAQTELDARGFADKIMRGEMSHAEANKEFGKVVTRELKAFCEKKAPEYNLEFTVENRNVGKSADTNDYILLDHNYTAKADDTGESIILDKETEEKNDAAFQEWLNRSTTAKAAPKSKLFVGLKINGASSLAIKGGEDPNDFHVTLAYGHFDQGGDDEDSVDARVQSSIKEIRDLIPDEIHFDALGRFPASESSDGMDVIYAQVAAGQLEKAHDGLLAALKKHGIKLEVTFPEYKPHMTLAYIEPGTEYELGEIDAAGTATKVMIGHGRESTHENDYTIMKTDDDKRLVFGWASIAITADGEQLEDLQHDMIDPEDLEETVYEYVLNFRDTGEQHNPNLRKKGKLVESCVFTAEKQKAMGLPEGILPVGWWIGFKIEDDEAWEKVKNRTYKMFSIEGKAQRVPVEKAAPVSMTSRFVQIREFP